MEQRELDVEFNKLGIVNLFATSEGVTALLH